MKKIEKLEIPDTNAVIGLADRDGKEIEIKAIGRKINEIIDILNSRLFEPIITVHNQSQKQPEKQEEWERELRFTYGHLYYQNEEGEFCQIVNEIDDLIDFISQLLSESKEKAKIEVLEKVLEKKTNYEIEREEHGYRVTLEYVLADDIKKEIKLLKEGDDLQE